MEILDEAEVGKGLGALSNYRRNNFISSIQSLSFVQRQSLMYISRGMLDKPDKWSAFLSIMNITRAEMYHYWKDMRKVQ